MSDLYFISPSSQLSDLKVSFLSYQNCYLSKSDCWRGYNQVSQFFRHETVNHSYNFVDPVTGAHTQDIEASWKRIKFDLIKMKNIPNHSMQEYMYYYSWRLSLQRKDYNNIFDELIKVICNIMPI